MSPDHTPKPVSRNKTICVDSITCVETHCDLGSLRLDCDAGAAEVDSISVNTPRQQGEQFRAVHDGYGANLFEEVISGNRNEKLPRRVSHSSLHAYDTLGPNVIGEANGIESP
jgi:hypothetical protein